MILHVGQHITLPDATGRNIDFIVARCRRTLASSQKMIQAALRDGKPGWKYTKISGGYAVLEPASDAGTSVPQKETPDWSEF